jgi:hypothetical protein
MKIKRFTAFVSLTFVVIVYIYYYYITVKSFKSNEINVQSSASTLTSTNLITEKPKNLFLVTVNFIVSTDIGVGTVIISVNKKWSPLGSERFLELVESSFFDGAKFFRVIKVTLFGLLFVIFFIYYFFYFHLNSFLINCFFDL